MNRILTTYVNCSLGGMTSVYRGRSLHHPDVQFDHIFEVDRGGISAFSSLKNSTVRIVDKSRLANYMNYVLATNDYRELRITSNPKLLDKIEVPENTSVIYEFHSPEPSILKRELEVLDLAKVDEVWAPSEWAVELVRSLLPARKHVTIRSVSNLVDEESFQKENGKVSKFTKRSGRPVSWIGRLENTQKNYLDFLRILKLLPSEYYGLVMFSYENTPERLERFLGDAAMLGVLERVQIYSNVPQTEVAAVHRGVRDAGGVFCSTALSESFGYAVLEAGLCGCPVVSYDVGPLSAHEVGGVHFTAVGDLRETAEEIRRVCETQES